MLSLTNVATLSNFNIPYMPKRLLKLSQKAEKNEINSGMDLCER